MMTFRHWIAFGMLALGVAACSLTGQAPNRNAEIIVVGDSILAWHRNSARSIPSVVARSSGLTVSDVSISGAPFLGPNGIPTQYVASDWDWVIVNGGGNDLDGTCQTPNGSRVLDALISSNGSQGAIPAFVNQAAAQGAQVIVLGYYPVSDRGGPFAACRAILAELAARQARLAASNPDVIFVDSGLVIAPGDASAYAVDLVHPSLRGAALIEELVASVIAGNGRERGPEATRVAVSRPATVLPIPRNCQARAAVLPLLAAIPIPEQETYPRIEYGSPYRNGSLRHCCGSGWIHRRSQEDGDFQVRRFQARVIP
jgi:acyl-CoA thioesterase-1